MFRTHQMQWRWILKDPCSCSKNSQLEKFLRQPKPCRVAELADQNDLEHGERAQSLNLNHQWIDLLAMLQMHVKILRQRDTSVKTSAVFLLYIRTSRASLMLNRFTAFFDLGDGTCTAFFEMHGVGESQCTQSSQRVTRTGHSKIGGRWL